MPAINRSHVCLGDGPFMMTIPDFHKWIDVFNVEGRTLGGYPPNFDSFRRIDVIKTYLLNPLWMFTSPNYDRGPKWGISDELRYKIVLRIIEKHADRAAYVYSYARSEYSSYGSFVDFCDHHFPSWTILMI